MNSENNETAMVMPKNMKKKLSDRHLFLAPFGYSAVCLLTRLLKQKAPGSQKTAVLNELVC
jgi:hypothetical protein